MLFLNDERKKKNEWKEYTLRERKKKRFSRVLGLMKVPFHGGMGYREANTLCTEADGQQTHLEPNTCSSEGLFCDMCAYIYTGF